MKHLIFLLIITILSTHSLFAQDPSPDEFREKLESLTTIEIKKFTILAEKNDPKAQVIIGLKSEQEAIPYRRKNDYRTSGKKLREAISWLIKAEKQNYAPAQYFLAEFYEQQKGVTLDCAKVLNWLDKAIGSKYAAAYSYKAWLYSSKRCVKRDYQKSLVLYQQSFELGHIWGAVGAGDILSDLGGSENEKEANKWYLKAAKAGSATAQDKIAIRISEGIGTKSDNKEAVKWFKKSAEQGHVYGACNLAIHYAHGAGIKKNSTLALKWSFISNALDGLKCHPDDFVEFLKPSKTVIDEASKQALEWLRKHPKLNNNFGTRPWLDKE